MLGFSQHTNIDDTTIVELITFESESVFFKQGTPTTNIWQIGQPSKVGFNQSYSAPYAIITDSINPYPTNNHSYFDLVIDFNEQFNWPNLGIGFYHKLNTTAHNDGGYITVSYDKGVSWTNIVYDTLGHFMHTPAQTYFPNVNLYSKNDLLANKEPGFSGDITEWQYTEFYWVMAMVTKSFTDIDTLMVRFNFISDSIAENKEGWMIDDLRVFYNHDFGSVSESNYATSFHVFPNPSAGEINVNVETFTKDLNYYIANIAGAVIQTGVLNSSKQTINIKKQGIYFISLTDGLTQSTKKIIIQ